MEYTSPAAAETTDSDGLFAASFAARAVWGCEVEVLPRARRALYGDADAPPSAAPAGRR